MTKVVPMLRPSWRERSRGGTPVPSLYNSLEMIRCMGIECRYDVFHDKVIVDFRGQEHEIRTLIGEMSNKTLVMLRQMMSDKFGIDPTEKFVYDAVNIEAFKRCFDPVLDMLEKAQTEWDETPRLDKWVVDYLGCEDTDLNRAIGRKVLIAACRRARHPGCKFDNIIVLESPEGRHKSTAIHILAGEDNFSDQSILGARDKEVQEQLTGIWMHENADLAGMRRADVEHVKSFASRQIDRARPAYGRTVERKPRRSIEWGTTNNNEYLQSQTGNRRFWPLTTGKILVNELKKDRLQILGEAAVCESTGESLLLSEELWPKVADAQEARRTKDPWEDILSDIPETKLVNVNGHDASNEGYGIRILHTNLQENKIIVKSTDLLTYVLDVPPAQQTTGHGMRLALVMKSLGWQRNDHNKVTIDGISVRGYWKNKESPT